MKENTKKHLDRLIERYPSLDACRGDIERAFELIAADLASGGKILVCGNGGSAADAQHIVGELMKGFLKSRPLPDEISHSIEDIGGERGRYIASKLQGALPAIALVGQDAFFTAFANDVDASLIFAQQVYALGNKHDVLIGISTSGNSANVIDALYVAKAVGVDTVGLTGRSGGKMDGICDITVKVPAIDTPDVQELHMPVYHTLCAMLEEELI
ncbi:SIS domain-containing protein [Mahella sp.]|uniref:D-sedoheptulose-7-phosphate isomerase n=1 Tax=Mahella sp. TaxID=2798721 RepID=UPI0025C20CF1|nr:SIS domain-containing protein [Mahella sp.]MBZ4665908.1 sugar isomerase [Mahella sp.]